MRVPHEYFIRYLITLNHDYDSVNRTLRSYGLSEVRQRYYDHLIAEVAVPHDFVGNDRRRSSSLTCLRTNGIAELWFRQEYYYVDKAFAILSNNAHREFVDVMAATPATSEQIANGLKNKFGCAVDPDTIMFYTRVFCNYARMTPDEIRDYAMENQEYWRIAALEGDMELLQYHLGLDVKISADRIIQDILSIGYFKIRQLRHLPATIGNAKAYSDFVRGVQWSAEHQQASQDKLMELTKALEVKYDEATDPVYEEELPGADIAELEAEAGADAG